MASMEFQNQPKTVVSGLEDAAVAAEAAAAASAAASSSPAAATSAAAAAPTPVSRPSASTASQHLPNVSTHHTSGSAKKANR